MSTTIAELAVDEATSNSKYSLGQIALLDEQIRDCGYKLAK